VCSTRSPARQEPEVGVAVRSNCRTLHFRITAALRFPTPLCTCGLRLSSNTKFADVTSARNPTDQSTTLLLRI
jgi:hypothetical protein